MLQNIEPYQLDISYQPRGPHEGDLLLVFRGDQLLLASEGPDSARLPDISLLRDRDGAGAYLFAIDDRAFFLAPPQALNHTTGFTWHKVLALREQQPQWLVFAAITGHHLHQWLTDHEYCGRCGAQMEKSLHERALCCPRCGLVEYPRISPAVIVGVRDGEKLLLARSAIGTYRRYGLIAGFVEIGEALEDTVRREVREETGLKVGRLQYFASQPWAFSGSLLMGFYADLEGDNTVSLNDGELAEATWFDRHDLPESANLISLTATMIEAFRNNRDK